MPFKKLTLIALSLLLIFGCSDDEPPSDTLITSPNGVYILNEGTMGASIGSLSYYNPDLNKVYDHVFQNANDGEELGDVVQSMILQDGKGFIVVNNSHKIEIIDLATQQRVQTMYLDSGFSPRHLLMYDSATAYITSLYSAASVAVIDRLTYTISDTILVGNNPEELVLANGKIYVANSGLSAGHTVSVIDPLTNSILYDIDVADNPVNLAVDENGLVWVNCWGQYSQTDGVLMVIDPSIDAVVDSLMVAGNTSRLAFSGDGTGYFISKRGVASFSTITHELTQDPFIENPFIDHNFYAIGIDPASGDIFVSDAGVNYGSRGDVYVYDNTGEMKAGPFTAGIIPTQFVFSAH